MHKSIGVFSLALALLSIAQSAGASLTAFELADTACAAYVTEYEASISAGDVYVQRVNTAMRLAWIAGFVSAIRMYIPTDKDLFSRIDPEHIKLWLLEYCTTYPTNTLREATNALYEELKQRR